MTRERDERLIQGYLDRVLTPPEIEEFDRLLVSDREFRRAFVEAARHESFLEGSLKELSTPASSIPTREAPARPSTRHRLDRAYLRTKTSYWTPILIAAGVLFGIVVLVSVPGSGPKAPKSDRPQAKTGTEKVKSPEPPELPPAPSRVEADRRPKDPEPKPPAPAPEVSPDAKRQEEADRVRRIEEEMRRKLDQERPRQPAPTPEAPAKPVRQDPPKPDAEKRDVTQAAVAKVECTEGEAFLVSASGRRLIKGTEDVLPGQGLETGVTPLRAVVVFPDGTRVEVGPGTQIQAIRADGGKRVVVLRGTVTADVAKQPKDEPMLFPTPHGEAKVLGTTLRLLVDADPRKGSRMDVIEGKVELTRKSDGKAVEVVSGHFAVAAVGITLESRRSPIDDIVLFPRDGKIKGGEWRVEKDPQAFTGSTLHAPKAWSSDLSILAMKQGTLGYVEFEFDADADQAYSVWVRAKCPPNADIGHDGVALSLPKDLFVKPCGYFKSHGVFDAHLFTAYFYKEGYGWGSNEETPTGGTKPNLVAVAQIRFTNPGRQVMRLYPAEGPIRVDAIWLSKTVTQRPVESSPLIPAAAASRAKAK